MSNIKFYNNEYWQFKYDLKDSIVDKRRFNHPIKREDIDLSVLKEYNLLCNY